MKHAENSPSFKSTSKRVAPILLASSLALASCAGNEAPAQPTVDTTEINPLVDASAKCDAIEYTVVDSLKRIVHVKTSHTLLNGATYEDTSYIFESDKNAVTIPANQSPVGETTYDYPDLAGEQTYTIRAIIDYSEPNSMKVFGSTDMCEATIIFK